MASPGDAIQNGEVNFDFITDEKLRHSLISDYGELLRCLESGAWKAVHVLAGSIVEAILVDYLLAAGHKKAKVKDPLRMELAETIEACRKDGVLSEKARDLSSVIRGYRNLIHPGRVIRLRETITPKTAGIAKALVDVVVDEISASKKERWGFTAEQIANKIEKDSSAMTILSHFLNDAKECERVRLLTHVIPARYHAVTADDPFGPGSLVSDLRRCFRETFETLSVSKKRVVAKQFIRVLKEEQKERVFEYETAFFRGADIKYLNADEAALAKEHILSRLDKEHTPMLLDAISGLGASLDQKELTRLIDALMKVIAWEKVVRVKERARDALKALYLEIPNAYDEAMKKRLDEWIRFLTEKNLEAEVELTREVRVLLDPPPPTEEDIPF